MRLILVSNFRMNGKYWRKSKIVPSVEAVNYLGLRLSRWGSSQGQEEHKGLRPGQV